VIIAIHKSKTGFHPRWIAYCKENNIPYKLVNCYDNDLIKQLEDCHALMWHHAQQNPKDLVIAKQILFALEHTGFQVFPDFKTGWHFDDKLGQKYLFERIGLPFVKSYAFYDKKEALAWVNTAKFPKVFKFVEGQVPQM
jgi:glutathione synthase/RimK-type ligase-like ATP-grasp enzyme